MIDVKALDDPDLQAAALAVWRVACELDDAGRGDAYLKVYGLVDELTTEVRRREDLLLDARVEVEWGGHLVDRVDRETGQALCRCGWRSPGEADPADAPEVRSHLEPHGAPMFTFEAWREARRFELPQDG
ncbi:MAG: hypothetical protein JJT89_06535 [Nitriliruptoraceae bacterium]|nr:hypothetical protein [Nitriliruptoraceae bacterium]